MVWDWMIHLNQKTWDLLQKVQAQVNNKVKYKKDIDNYGKSDYWAVALNNLGDCEDYALAKQKTLKAKGIESWLALCWIKTNRYHAVVIVHTDKGDMVLDNRYYDVRPARELKYRWHKIERPGGKWCKLSL